MIALYVLVALIPICLAVGAVLLRGQFRHREGRYFGDGHDA